MSGGHDFDVVLYSALYYPVVESCTEQNASCSSQLLPSWPRDSSFPDLGTRHLGYDVPPVKRHLEGPHGAAWYGGDGTCTCQGCLSGR